MFIKSLRNFLLIGILAFNFQAFGDNTFKVGDLVIADQYKDSSDDSSVEWPLVCEITGLQTEVAKLDCRFSRWDEPKCQTKTFNHSIHLLSKAVFLDELHGVKKGTVMSTFTGSESEGDVPTYTATGFTYVFKAEEERWHYQTRDENNCWRRDNFVTVDTTNFPQEGLELNTSVLTYNNKLKKIQWTNIRGYRFERSMAPLNETGANGEFPYSTTTPLETYPIIPYSLHYLTADGRWITPSDLFYREMPQWEVNANIKIGSYVYDSKSESILKVAKLLWTACEYSVENPNSCENAAFIPLDEKSNPILVRYTYEESSDILPVGPGSIIDGNVVRLGDASKQSIIGIYDLDNEDVQYGIKTKKLRQLSKKLQLKAVAITSDLKEYLVFTCDTDENKYGDEAGYSPEVFKLCISSEGNEVPENIFAIEI